MKQLPYFLILSTFLLAGLVSCNNKKDDVVNCSAAWGTDLQDELTAVSNTGVAYATNPTAANCDAYKAAYQAYIDALEPYGNCAELNGQNRTDWEKALQEARDSLTGLCD